MHRSNLIYKAILLSKTFYATICTYVFKSCAAITRPVFVSSWIFTTINNSNGIGAMQLKNILARSHPNYIQSYFHLEFGSFPFVPPPPVRYAPPVTKHVSLHSKSL